MGIHRLSATALLVLATLGALAAIPASARAEPLQTPAQFAHDYDSRNLARWSADVGARLREMVPQVQGGTPASALLGFASGAELYEDTGAINPVTGRQANPVFHEVGYLGIEAGPSDGPAPPRAPSSYNRWGRFRADPTVLAILRHPAGGNPGAWHDLDSQLAVGLVSLRDHGRELAARLDPRLRPLGHSSLWAVALSFMSWSSGDPRPAALIGRYTEALAAVDETRRWGELIRLLSLDLRCGRFRPRGSRHNNPVFTVLRTLQKLEAGRALANQVGDHPEWYATGMSSSEEDLAYRAISYNALAHSMTSVRLPASDPACAPPAAITPPAAAASPSASLVQPAMKPGASAPLDHCAVPNAGAPLPVLPVDPNHL